jgi:hypothetical protein
MDATLSTLVEATRSNPNQDAAIKTGAAAANRKVNFRIFNCLIFSHRSLPPTLNEQQL